jgi:ABC-type multidrug transport system fused ATPase/permease subunit
MNAYEYTMHDLADPGEAAPKNKKQAETNKLEKIHSVRFNNVDFKYNGEPVLSNFGLQIECGDFLAISGASGQGKTTIINLLLGFLHPHKGEILINESMHATEHRHWENISYIKQQTFLFHDTIMKNIVMDLDMVPDNKLEDAVSKAGLMDLVGHYPSGLHKIIMENGKNISGGQRQRIALARALYRDADLVILDEPFNELDERSEYALLEIFKKMAEAGKMIILVTHHSKSLSFCNKIISLDA